MVALTDGAQNQLDGYLRQVRSALRGHASVDANEVERDVRSHIDSELVGQPEPIDVTSLRHVLDRLGPPRTWVPTDDLPPWRRVLGHLRSGPEDWRLAYLSLALFCAGPVLFLFGGPPGRSYWPLEPFLVVVSILMARASMAILAAHDEPVGARAWLIYPPLILWCGALALALLAWPLPLAGGAMTDDPAVRERMAAAFSGDVWLSARAGAVTLLGLWWTLLGLLCAGFPWAVRATFFPFADWFERRHGVRLAIGGFVVFLLAGSVLAAMMKR